MGGDEFDYYRTAILSGERLRARVALDPEAAELVDRIKHAFAHWPANAGLTWVQGEMLDNHEPAEVLREGARIGVHERWQDVPPELLATFPCAGWFLDDAGLNFYWPALMGWELLYGPTYELASPAEILKKRTERLRPQTDEQSEVFAAYRKYINGRMRGTPRKS